MAADPTPAVNPWGHEISGPTTTRPTNSPTGATYYDTTLGQLIIWNGTGWDLMPVTGVAGVAAGYKIARGTSTMAAASSNINTGLATVVAATVSFYTSPTANLSALAALNGTAAGWIQIRSMKATTGTSAASNAVTPADATTFSDNIVVSWTAVGT